MVDAAASVGVEIIKHQTHVVMKNGVEARNIKPGNADISIYEICQSFLYLRNQKECCKSMSINKDDIHFNALFGVPQQIDWSPMNVPAYKIGSVNVIIIHYTSI